MKRQADKNIARELENIKFALDEAATVAVTDSRGVITYVNDRFCEISKYARAELLGRTPRLVNSGFHPKEFFRDLWETIKSGKTWRGKIKNKAKDGSFYWVSTTIVPFLGEDGRPREYIAILHDITSLKEAEQVIVETNQLLEQTYDAIFIWNIDDGLIAWNQNAERLYGFRAKEAIGKEVRVLLKTVYPKNHASFLAEIREKGFWEGELVHTTKTGEQVVVESRLRVIRRDGDNIVVLETLHDVTERRQMESKLARASQLSMVGELAAGLAHEIKNPLTGIKGVIDIILKRRAMGDAEREILEDVRHEIERIDFTVRELLRQSRPKPMEIKPAVLDETIRRAAQFAAHPSGVRYTANGSVRTRLVLPKEAVIFPHDAASIEDAVLNLLLNAKEAVREREKGEITVRLAKTKTKSRQCELRIEVADNGCGIPKDKLEQIFVPFYTTHEGGTGLGLAAVKRIARAHGGSCEVRSTIGKGSTFTIRLPLDCAAGFDASVF